MTESWNNGCICPVCGKEFYTSSLHVYKDTSGNKLCSWSCLCKHRKQHEEEMQGKQYKNVRKFKINGEYLTVEQIAKKAGVSRSTINLRIKRGIKGEALLSPRIIKQKKEG